MITLKINDIEVHVKKGSTILEAAEQAGVYIPTLCHDKRIAPYGACRLCIVEDRKKPGNLIPSCFTPAKSNMDIITESPEILQAITRQLKLILINHPLDCPVCDKAGECTLQELVIRYHITEMPYGCERLHKKVDRESPLIERDMNRCILCGRCVRICRELQGCEELDFMQRGYKTYIGTDGGRPLNCDFCGLCVSTCPVGAITDKLFKNTTRIWKLEKKQTICSHCGLGCLTEVHTENGQIRRITPPTLKNGKKGVLCVRGQFGWKIFDEKRRLTSPYLRQGSLLKPTSWDEALIYASERLSAICQTYGGESIAALTADQITTEEAYAYREFFHSCIGSSRMTSIQASGYRKILSTLHEELGPNWKLATPMDCVDADILLILGGGAAEYNPVVKPMINRLLKKMEKEVVVISSWPDFFFEKATLPIAVTPGLLDEFFNDLREALTTGKRHSPTDVYRYGLDTSQLARLVSLLRGDKEITILIVPQLYGDNVERTRLAAALNDRAHGILPLGAQFNSAGAVMRAGFADSDDGSFEKMLRGIEEGAIRALYLLGEDPLEGYPDSERVKNAIKKLDLLICQSPFKTSITDFANVVLPTALPMEKEGSTLSLLGVENEHRVLIPRPEGVHTDMDIITVLVEKMGFDTEPFQWSRIRQELAEVSGRRISSFRSKMDATQDTPKVKTPMPHYLQDDFPFKLFPVPSIFGEGILTRQSDEMNYFKKNLRIIMNSEEFEKWNFMENENIEIRTPFGSACGIVEHVAGIDKGFLLLQHTAGNSEGLSLVRSGYAVLPASIQKRDNLK